MIYPDPSALRDFPGWQAARAVRAAGPGGDAESLRRAYLELLKLALCDLTGSGTSTVGRRPDGRLSRRELRGEDRRLRAAGMDWPLHGLTMIGLNRLDDLQACVEAVVRDGVAGDLIEAGAWRGGASILMRATLDSLGASDRTVHVADSFQGFPSADEQGELNQSEFLAVPVDEVRDAFARFGLDSGVSFVPGFFETTMPALEGRRWSLLRLDGDTYEATWVTLASLYPGLARGGYVIVDDYGAMPECGRAVDAFRRHHGIAEPLEQVDWTCVRWRREDDGPLGPPGRTPFRAQPREVRPVTGRPEVQVHSEREFELEARLAAAEAELARLRRSPLRAWLAARRRST
jgi:O-methyltransferase